MTLTAKYDFFQFVYLKADIEQFPRMVTKVEFSAFGGVVYQLFCGKDVSYHYEGEISSELDETKRLF